MTSLEGPPQDIAEWFGTPLQPMPGGYSGETFLVGADDDEQYVLRIYRRQPERGLVDASLLRLVAGILPVPEVVDFRRATGDEPAILVTARLPGVALDEVLRAAPPDLDWELLGLDLGALLGTLSGIPFLRFGMFEDEELRLSDESAPADDLIEWAQHMRDTGRLAAWSDQDWHALIRLVEGAEDLLEEDASERPPRAVLCHSDFNPKNLLVDPETWEVTGLLDWEFAHAGSVHTDIGNFTRFERDERLLEPLVEGFVNTAPGWIHDPIRHGRAMDLWALIELAGRVRTNPVTELASELLLAQARTGDLEAWPWPGEPRIDPVRSGHGRPGPR